MLVRFPLELPPQRDPRKGALLRAILGIIILIIIFGACGVETALKF